MLEERLYDQEGITPLTEEVEDTTREEEDVMPSNCTPHYGCSACQYYYDCPDGQMFM